jgi:cellulose synthase/poly-beta-1,6-N-acetylglucosamine synthase-like glycosyltransferase/phosphoheptose isomerase
MGTSNFTKTRQKSIPTGTKASMGSDSRGNVWAVRLTVALGAVAIGFYFSWWFVEGRLDSIWMVLLFASAVAYTGIQMVGNWILYLLARLPASPPAIPPGTMVDVYVTAYREPYAMIERSLTAAVRMRGEHHTWLLDDGSDPALEAMAERLGAGYLARSDHRHAKAGNINAALPFTGGDIIAIFDIDHVPKPDFLERSVGYFVDPQIGFVQVMLTFNNGGESWVAQAAMETSLEFYNPTYLGSNAVGGATMMGSNAIIRREALESIRGYQPGLAEDLATSLALHSAGWKSAYVPEPLAPGQAPPSFSAWFIQQLKWARGVFEMLLTTFPKVFSRLTWGQRLAYAVRTTRYWIGPAIGLHLLATIAILIFAAPATSFAFHQYLIRIAPLVVCDALIRAMAMRAWQHPATPRSSLTRAIALIYATWPIYMLAWVMAVMRLSLPFRSTPKSGSRLSPVWLLPQIITVALLAAGMFYTVVMRGHPISLLLLFALIQGVLELVILAQWFLSDVGIKEGLPRYLRVLKGQLQSARVTRQEVDGKVRSYLINLPFDVDPLPLDQLERLITLLHSARVSGARQVVIGDRDSECITRLLATDLAQYATQDGEQVYLIKDKFSAWSAAGNWKGETEFKVLDPSRLEKFFRPGDVLILIAQEGSTSEMLAATRFANQAGAHSIGITGLSCEDLARQVEVNLHLSSDSSEQFENFFLFLENLIAKSLRSIDRQESTEQLAGRAPLSESLVGRENLEPLLGYSRVPNGIASSARINSALEKLLVLKESLSVTPPLDQCLRLVLRTGLEVFDAPSGSLLLLDREGRATRAAIAYDGQVHLYPPEHFIDTLQRGLASWVIAQKQPALVTDTRKDERWLRRSWEEQTGSRSAISVPLFEAGEVIGVMTLAFPGAGRFSQSDLLLLAAIAMQYPPVQAGLSTVSPAIK